MHIPRLIKKTILKRLKTSNKAIVIYGTRQVGKTTLVNEIVKETHLKTLVINADRRQHLDILSSRNLTKLESLVGNSEMIIIDEAQRIPDIGINLKILIDTLPKLKIIATGSSSFELANRIQEPLTGRTWNYRLYPISFQELQNLSSSLELEEKLEDLLLYGSYPEIFHYKGSTDKRQYLETLVQSYLYKDALELASIKYSEKIHSLLQLVAYQIGSEVSIQELSSALQISREAVDRYLDLLEKSFVLFKLHGFSRNLRKEVSKMDKIYFYDVGVRNALLSDFKPIEIRADKGQIWENWLVAERKKRNEYSHSISNGYFWRTHTGAELDYVEEKDGKLTGYEFKFNSKKVKAPKTWISTYKNSIFRLVNRDNFRSFIS